MPKKFHIGDILSITTGATLSTRKMDGIADIMSYLVGKKVSTIGLLTAHEEVRKSLEEQLPWVKKVEFPEIPEGIKDSASGRQVFCENFLRRTAARYGEFHEIKPMANPPDLSLKSDLALLKKIKSKPPTKKP